jgi:two-component system LytT family response regulator
MEKIVKSHTAETSRYRSSFNIKDKGDITEVYVDEVIMMEADGNYIRLVTPQKTYLLRLSMNNLEHDLNPDHFIRIHRSFILNKHAIKAQKYLGNNEYEFIMNNDKRVTSSRSFKSIIQKSFSS